MAIHHLPTYSETTATSCNASSSSQEGATDPAMAITIDTRRGDVIESNKKQTARERDSFFMSLIGLVGGGWIYLSGYLLNRPTLKTMALVPIVLSLLEPAGVARVALSFAFGIRRRNSGTNAVVGDHAEEATAVADNPPDDTALIQYKQILRSILPPEFLSAEGFLRTATGEPEPIAIRHKGTRHWISKVLTLVARARFDPSGPPASYYGPMCYRALLYRIVQSRTKMALHEFQALRDLAEARIRQAGPKDIIDIRQSKYRGVLAHETFHDIQNFLYENHPDVIARIWEASDKLFPEIERWYTSEANAAYREPTSYRLEHFFPTEATLTPYPHLTHEWVSAAMSSRVSVEGNLQFPSMSVMVAICDAERDLGRNELVPTLLSAASEGDENAAEILAEIFEDAGLNEDFYKTLPRVVS